MLGPGTLRQIYRLIGQVPFVATRQGRQAWFLGIGPKGKMVGWWAGSDEIEEFDADDGHWRFQIRLGS